jgi:hypothetical protein
MEDRFWLKAIRLPEGVSAEDFEKFMLEDVFPAIPKESSRSGQVSGLRLFRGNNVENLKDYLWVVYGTVNGGPARGQLERIEAFGAQVSDEGVRDGEYVEAARWPASGQ